MSTFGAFEKAKLTRFVNTYGNLFAFKRSALNAYGEPIEQTENVVTIQGVYHEASSGYEQEANSNGSQIVKAVTPMILCLQDEDSAKIMPDDFVEIYSKKFVVVRLNNIGKLGVGWDISLRMVEDGGNT